MDRKGISWIAWHLDGHRPTGLDCSRPFRIEHLATLINRLGSEGADRVCFAGRVARPRLDLAIVDAATAPLIPRLQACVASGDDAALRTIVAFFEEAGLAVVSPHDLAPQLLDVPRVGVPSARDLSDIERALGVLEAMGAIDVGQGCVVAGGQVLAMEALPGTDWMLASLQSGLLPTFARPEGGVLLKMPKLGQDRRIDLPTIGPKTIRAAAAAGLGGIAVEAGGVLVLDAAELEAVARAAGLFVHPIMP